jgi:hydroxymethylbilane synthase
MLPQVGQGAIAVECRASDHATRALLEAIDAPSIHAAVTAERAYLARLGGGCDLPVGAFAQADGAAGGMLVLEGLMASREGRVVLRSSVTGSDAEPARLGRTLADELLAAGGADLLGPAFDAATQAP